MLYCYSMQKLTLEQIKQKIVPVLKEEGVIKSSLFGSYVRGEQNDDSDIDILIDYPQNKSIFDFVHLKNRLEEILEKKVDLVEYDAIKPRLKQYILPEQIQIL